MRATGTTCAVGTAVSSSRCRNSRTCRSNRSTERSTTPSDGIAPPGRTAANLHSREARHAPPAGGTRSLREATGKKTTNLANTNATKVGQFPIPLPPLAEQEAICAHLDEKTAEVNRITATITAQIDTLIAYRKSLIHECVTGQRRITDEDVNRVTAHAATFA